MPDAPEEWLNGINGDYDEDDEADACDCMCFDDGGIWAARDCAYQDGCPLHWKGEVSLNGKDTDIKPR